MARAEGGVAAAEENEVAVEGSVGVNVAAGYGVGGPGEDVYGQKGLGGGSGGELDVGGGNEEAAFIEAIEGLAVEGRNADAEGGVAQGRFGENTLNAVSELAGCGAGAGGRMGGSRLLGEEPSGEQSRS